MRTKKSSAIGHFKKSSGFSDLTLNELVFSDFTTASALLLKPELPNGIVLTKEQKDQIWDFKVDYLLSHLSLSTALSYFDILPCLIGEDWQYYSEEPIYDEYSILYGHKLQESVSSRLHALTQPFDRLNDGGEAIKAELKEMCSKACLAPNAYSSMASFVGAIKPMLFELHEHASYQAKSDCLHAFSKLMKLGYLEAYYYIHDCISYKGIHSAPATVLDVFLSGEHEDKRPRDVVCSKLAKEFYLNISSIRNGDKYSLSWLNEYSPEIVVPEEPWVESLKGKAKQLLSIFPSSKASKAQIDPVSLSGVTLYYGCAGSGLGTSILSHAAHSVSEQQCSTIIVMNDGLNHHHINYDLEYTKMWLSLNFLNKENRNLISSYQIKTREDLVIAGKFPKIYFMDYTWLRYCMGDRELRKHIDFTKFHFIIQSLEGELEGLNDVIASLKNNHVKASINMNGWPYFVDGADDYVFHKMEDIFNNECPFYGSVNGTYRIDRRDLLALHPGEVIHFKKEGDSYTPQICRNYYEMI
ncbi:hypothetical protein [Vibrio owensii]|uniref:hypothetical protein n=1 Tax=Vibrio owensii TaxID=696485 RepID=UPI003CC57BA9